MNLPIARGAPRAALRPVGSVAGRPVRSFEPVRRPGPAANRFLRARSARRPRTRRRSDSGGGARLLGQSVLRLRRTGRDISRVHSGRLVERRRRQDQGAARGAGARRFCRESLQPALREGLSGAPSVGRDRACSPSTPAIIRRSTLTGARRRERPCVSTFRPRLTAFPSAAAGEWPSRQWPSDSHAVDRCRAGRRYCAVPRPHRPAIRAASVVFHVLGVCACRQPLRSRRAQAGGQWGRLRHPDGRPGAEKAPRHVLVPLGVPAPVTGVAGPHPERAGRTRHDSQPRGQEWPPHAAPSTR